MVSYYKLLHHSDAAVFLRKPRPVPQKNAFAFFGLFLVGVALLITSVFYPLVWLAVFGFMVWISVVSAVGYRKQRTVASLGGGAATLEGVEWNEKMLKPFLFQRYGISQLSSNDILLLRKGVPVTLNFGDGQRTVVFVEQPKERTLWLGDVASKRESVKDSIIIADNVYLFPAYVID